MPTIYIVYEEGCYRWETISERTDFLTYSSMAKVERAIRRQHKAFRKIVYGVGKFAAALKS